MCESKSPKWGEGVPPSVGKGRTSNPSPVAAISRNQNFTVGGFFTSSATVKVSIGFWLR
jgi:hypothetical protein